MPPRPRNPARTSLAEEYYSDGEDTLGIARIERLGSPTSPRHPDLSGQPSTPNVAPNPSRNIPKPRLRLSAGRAVSPARSSQASFLGLPPELRNRIYHFMWPQELIHVGTRPCKPYDKGAWRTNFTQPTWAPQSKFVKWTHTVCQVPNDWQNVYGASKRPSSELEHKSSLASYYPLPEWCQSEDAMLNRHLRHDQCNWIQESFMEQRYISQCAHTWHKGHSPDDCNYQQDYDSSMRKQYGPPKSGLKRLYSSSKLSLHTLLVCKQIYQEAALLPYALSTFHFDYPSTLQAFVTSALDHSRVLSLYSLQIDGWPWSDVEGALDSILKLRTLHYACEYSTGHYGRKKMLDGILAQLRDDGRNQRKLERAEVIVGCNQGPSGVERGRDEWREQAREVERLLMGK